MKTVIIFLITAISVENLSISGAASSHASETIKYNEQWHSETLLNNTGKMVFENKCSGCHGIDGKRKRFGAADLSKSTLDYQGYYNIIMNGKRIMPSWRKKLTSTEIELVIKYIETFRKLK
jgi:cytochrome c6